MGLGETLFLLLAVAAACTFAVTLAVQSARQRRD